MENFKQFMDVDIYQQELDRGNGMLTILRGGWDKSDSKKYMDEVVRQYVANRPHNQFVEIHQDIPEMRVIIENLGNLTFQSLETIYS